MPHNQEVMGLNLTPLSLTHSNSLSHSLTHNKSNQERHPKSVTTTALHTYNLVYDSPINVCGDYSQWLQQFGAFLSRKSPSLHFNILPTQQDERI